MSKNCASPGSPTDSMKKKKSKDAEDSPASTANASETTIHENFVLMSTPDNFKDEPVGGENTSVSKSHNPEESLPQACNIDCLLLADMCRDSVPTHLQNILDMYHNSQLNQGESFFLLVYIVALETGFATAQDYAANEKLLCRLSSISSFHCKNVLLLSRLKPSYTVNGERTCFTMPLCSIVDLETSKRGENKALLLGFVTGGLMIVSLTPDNSTGAKGFSVAMSLGRYVLSVQRKNNPIHHRFCKLDELSLILRDKLFVPMRNQHLCRLNAGIYPALEAMPAELYDNIMKYLSVNQLKILANVSNSLYGLTRNNKRLLKNNKND